jgi:hypothetical protein
MDVKGEPSMKKFLALYIGSLSADEKARHTFTPDEERTIVHGMETWGNWVAQHFDSITDFGTPLGSTLLFVQIHRGRAGRLE